MALGELYEGRLGYAVGIFNGPRRSFQDFNSAKDVIGYVNSRPFLKSERFKALNYLNLGGSFDVGYQNNPTQPPILTTANDETACVEYPTVDSLSPTFLAFNNNVVEQGQRNQWAGHMVWYYKSLMVLTEYGGGVAGYALTKSKTSTYIPYNGYMVQASLLRHGRGADPARQRGQAEARLQLGQGQAGPGRVGGSWPLQHARLRQGGLHRGLCRSESVEQPRLGNGRRPQLVSELLHESLPRLAALRVRQPRV